MEPSQSSATVFNEVDTDISGTIERAVESALAPLESRIIAQQKEIDDLEQLLQKQRMSFKRTHCGINRMKSLIQQELQLQNSHAETELSGRAKDPEQMYLEFLRMLDAILPWPSSDIVDDTRSAASPPRQPADVARVSASPATGNITAPVFSPDPSILANAPVASTPSPAATAATTPSSVCTSNAVSVGIPAAPASVVTPIAPVSVATPVASASVATSAALPSVTTSASSASAAAPAPSDSARSPKSAKAREPFERIVRLCRSSKITSAGIVKIYEDALAACPTSGDATPADWDRASGSLSGEGMKNFFLAAAAKRAEKKRKREEAGAADKLEDKRRRTIKPLPGSSETAMPREIQSPRA